MFYWPIAGTKQPGKQNPNRTSKSGHNHALTHGKHHRHKQKQSDRTLSDVPHWDSTFPKKFYILTTQNSGTTLHTTIIKRFHKNLILPRTWQKGTPSKKQINHLGASGKGVTYPVWYLYTQKQLQNKIDKIKPHRITSMGLLWAYKSYLLKMREPVRQGVSRCIFF